MASIVRGCTDCFYAQDSHRIQITNGRSTERQGDPDSLGRVDYRVHSKISPQSDPVRLNSGGISLAPL